PPRRPAAEVFLFGFVDLRRDAVPSSFGSNFRNRLMARTLYLPAGRVRRMLTRIAYEIVERNRGADNLELLGIRARGTALAVALAGEIKRIEGRDFQVHQLDIASFRDDRDRSVAVEEAPNVPVDVT